MKIGFSALCVFALLIMPCLAERVPPPPGTYECCWVGNTFSGSGGDNGFGYWVQNCADEIEVSQNGVIAAGCGWDEAGRCLGLYKDGKVNRVLLKLDAHGMNVWGFNTANHAVAIDGDDLYDANLGGTLIHYKVNHDDLDDWSLVGTTTLGFVAESANAHAGMLALASTNHVEIRRADALDKVVASWQLPTKDDGANGTIKDIVVGEDGSEIWMIVSDGIRRLQLKDGALADAPCGPFKTLGHPTAIALDHSNPGCIIVCDNGPDKQVKFYDVSKPAHPVLKRAFGDKRSFGKVTPTTFFAMRGAGTDAKGNLTVALGFCDGPTGNLIIRTFDPKGKLLWEVASHAFVDTFCFDPKSDGHRVFTRTGIIEINPDSRQRNLEWRLVATTIDPEIETESDFRAIGPASMAARFLDGRYILYTIGQYGHGFQLFAVDDKNDMLARPAGKITTEAETWAWSVDSRGDVWNGDAPADGHAEIRRYKFKEWRRTDKGHEPIFETENPDCWPWPEGFRKIGQVIYTPEDDTLFVAGYLDDDTNDSWGLVGKTIRRYDNWTSGNPTMAWSVASPRNNAGGKDELSAKAICEAGDYLFLGVVHAEPEGHPLYVMSKNNGSIVGAFYPDEEVIGKNVGWLDMVNPVTAIRRSNGEYLVLCEEDFRGKNIIYRWKP